MYYIILYIILYHIILYYIILYIIFYYIILYYIILYYVILYFIALYYIVLYYIIYSIILYILLQYIILYYIVLNYIILYILYYTIYIIYRHRLYYIVLYCIILYYIILHYNLLYITLYFVLLYIVYYIMLYCIILYCIILYYFYLICCILNYMLYIYIYIYVYTVLQELLWVPNGRGMSFWRYLGVAIVAVRRTVDAFTWWVHVSGKVDQTTRTQDHNVSQVRMQVTADSLQNSLGLFTSLFDSCWRYLVTFSYMPKPAMDFLVNAFGTSPVHHGKVTQAEVDDTSLQFLADGISSLSTLRLDFSRCRVSFRGIQCPSEMGHPNGFLKLNGFEIFTPGERGVHG